MDVYFKLFLIAVLFPILSSCGKSKDDAADVTSVVESTPAEAIPSDLRADASTTYELPEILTNINPLTFTASASGSYSAGAGQLSASVINRKNAVLSDGRSHSFAACQNTIPVPATSFQATPTIDGDLSEWNSSSLIALDRAGDAPDDETGIDIRQVYFHEDASNFYIGVKTTGNWPTSGTTLRMIINFRPITIPSNTASDPSASTGRLYQLINSILYLNGSPVSGSVYSVSSQNNMMEFQIDKSQITAVTGSSPIALNLYTFKSSSSEENDYAAVHLIGLEDDYACLVPMPNASGVYDSFKMFVMRRTAGVDPKKAEMYYRSIIAAAPAIELVAKDQIRTFDTISVVVTDKMNSKGLTNKNMGIMLNMTGSNFDHETDINVETFYVASHEYAHILNGMDYRFFLSPSWVREGHSEWMANKAIESYYGKSVSQFRRSYNIRKFLAEEVTNGIGSMTETSWGDSPYSSLYYYKKAGTFFELMEQRFTYDDFLTNILQRGLTATPYTSDSAFLTAVTQLSSYTGNSSDDLGSGWTSGNYTDGNLSNSLLNDADGDGLYAFQEAALSTSDTNYDSDGDLISDAWEYMNGAADISSVTLAVDQFNKEWSSLLSSLSASSESGTCTKAKISSYAFNLDNSYFITTVDLTNLPTTSENIIVSVGIESGLPAAITVELTWGEQFAVIKDASGTKQRRIPLIAPFAGKTAEFAINAAWVGATSGFTADLSVRLKSNNGSDVCDQTDLLTVSLL